MVIGVLNLIHYANPKSREKVKSMEEHLIYSNDVVSTFNDIKANLQDYFPDLSSDDYDTIDDNQIWEEAYREVETNLHDEQSNCNIELEGDIVLIGTLERWYGSRNAHKELGTTNIGKAFLKAMQSWNGDNTFAIYTKGNKLLISQTGHDNPTNPSIMEFRVLKPGKTLSGSYPDMIMCTEPLGQKVAKIYNWEV